jgi:hypothetical protein
MGHRGCLCQAQWQQQGRVLYRTLGTMQQCLHLQQLSGAQGHQQWQGVPALAEGQQQRQFPQQQQGGRLGMQLGLRWRCSAIWSRQLQLWQLAAALVGLQQLVVVLVALRAGQPGTQSRCGQGLFRTMQTLP